MLLPTFGHFELVTDTQTFHPGGHWAVGGLYGTMTDTYCSPADPIFYLHHSNIDRTWWSWQTRNLAVREAEISGPLVFFDYGNAIAGNATLTTPVWVGLADPVEYEAGELLHIQKGPFCYRYDELY
jgi:tyrosinase